MQHPHFSAEQETSESVYGKAATAPASSIYPVGSHVYGRPQNAVLPAALHGQPVSPHVAGRRTVPQSNHATPVLGSHPAWRLDSHPVSPLSNHAGTAASGLSPSPFWSNHTTPSLSNVTTPPPGTRPTSCWSNHTTPCVNNQSSPHACHQGSHAVNHYPSSSPLGHGPPPPTALSAPATMINLPQQHAPPLASYALPASLYVDHSAHGQPSLQSPPPKHPEFSYSGMPSSVSVVAQVPARPEGYGRAPTWSSAPTLHMSLQSGPNSYVLHGTGFEQPANPRMTVAYGAHASYISNFQQTGRRRALLIGIKYLGMGPRMELHGCANDVKNMHYLLRTKFGFQDGDFRVLSDARRDMGLNVAMGEPTRKNILESMEWLVKDARPGDSLFFHFSGHGKQVPDVSGDEVDGFDEAIVPIDDERDGPIIDDTIHDIMVEGLPKGVRLTAVFDCCHSGTIMDLPFVHDGAGFGSGITIDRPSVTQSASAFEDSVMSFGGLSLVARVASKASALRRRTHKVSAESPNPNPNAGEVVLFSSCQDSQRSADTKEFCGIPVGAMTYCFIEAIEHGSRSNWREYNYRSLLQSMREKLRKAGFWQVPQFSSSHQFNLSSPFVI